MKIEQLDKNFAIVNQDNGEEKAVYTLPHESFDLYGVFYDQTEKQFRRVPKDLADKVSAQVKCWGACTSGGRIRFCTDSSSIGLEATYPSLVRFAHMPDTGCSGFTLLKKTDKGYKLVNTFRLEIGKEELNQTISLGGEMTEYILFLPLYNTVGSIKITLDKNATVKGGEKYRPVKPILYYGSSITQGGCASRPDNDYSALISKWNNIDFINLGFSGGAKAEELMVEHLLSYDVSLFVLDYDHNAPNANYLKKTHYALYKRYREVYPDTPILILSKPDFERSSHNKERYKVIKETYLKALSEGDKKVYFIAGKELFGKFDRENCTVDGTHPNDLGFYRMAKKIYKKLIQISEVFK